MSEFPIAKRELTKVKLGFVKGEQRGSNLMNPPKELDDYYYWLRDDKRTNKDVLNYLNDENTYTKKIMDFLISSTEIFQMVFPPYILDGKSKC